MYESEIKLIFFYPAIPIGKTTVIGLAKKLHQKTITQFRGSSIRTIVIYQCLFIINWHWRFVHKLAIFGVRTQYNWLHNVTMCCEMAFLGVNGSYLFDDQNESSVNSAQYADTINQFLIAEI